MTIRMLTQAICSVVLLWSISTLENIFAADNSQLRGSVLEQAARDNLTHLADAHWLYSRDPKASNETNCSIWTIATLARLAGVSIPDDKMPLALMTSLHDQEAIATATSKTPPDPILGGIARVLIDLKLADQVAPGTPLQSGDVVQLWKYRSDLHKWIGHTGILSVNGSGGTTWHGKLVSPAETPSESNHHIVTMGEDLWSLSSDAAHVVLIARLKPVNSQ